MPPKGGVRQQLQRAREERAAEERAVEAPVPEDGPGETRDTTRSYATGGRKRARSIGEFVSGLYLVGRLSAPEVQEGAEAASSSSGHVNDDLASLSRAKGAHKVVLILVL